MDVDSILRAAGSPYSTDVTCLTRVEARLFDATSAPRVGRFILSERLGRGGMGTVYAAFDPQLGRRVALKLLHPELSGVRMLREAQALACLRHPNILTIYEVGEAQGQAYIAMEYIDGRSFADLQRRGPVTWRCWLRRYLAAGRGLAAAHAARLVHRDFKPDNILVDHDDRVVVADFGLAKRSDDGFLADAVPSEAPPFAVDPNLTLPGTQPGTTRYMAPEQLAGLACDSRSDQYSFCLSFWESLHGELPLSPQERDDVVAWRTLRTERHTTPAWLRRRLLRGLHPVPSLRWPSMAMLIDSLQRDPWQRTARVVVPVMGLLAVSGVLWWLFHRPLQGELAESHARLAEREARLAESERNNEHERRRNSDERRLIVALKQSDPTIEVSLLAAVQAPDETPQWHSSALNALLNPISRAILRGHTDELRGACFSPDGRLVATASVDHTIRIWDTQGRGDSWVLRGHKHRVNTVQFSPDGRYLVSTSRDGTSRLWDISRNGMALAVFEHPPGKPVWYAAFSPDGSMIATGADDGKVRLWDISTPSQPGRPRVLDGHTGDVFHVEFSLDGQQLVSASKDRSARVWSVASGRLLHVLRQDSWVVRAHFSPDGRTIVAVSHDTPPALWDAANGRRRFAMREHPVGASDAVFSPDNTKIVTAGRDGRVTVWDIQTGKVSQALQLDAMGTAVAVSRDGQLIAAGDNSGRVRVWTTRAEGASREFFGHFGSIFQLEFDPSGRYLLSSAFDGTARVWDTSDFRGTSAPVLVRGIGNSVTLAASRGKIAVSWSGRGVSVHDSTSGGLISQVQIPHGLLSYHVLSPDSRFLATVVDNRSAFLWEVGSETQPRLLQGNVRALVFQGTDGLLVGDWAGGVSWYRNDGTFVGHAQGHDQEVESFSDLFAGRYVVSLGRDGRLVRWDLAGGYLHGQELNAPTGSRLNAHASCPGAGLIAVADTRNPKVKLWNVPDAIPLGELSIERGVPESLALDCWRDTLAVKTRSGWLQLWDLSAGEPVKLTERFVSFGGEVIVEFDSQRSLLLLASHTGPVHVFQGRDLAEVTMIHADTLGGVVRDGALLVIDAQRGILRVSLDALLRPAAEVRAELLGRTTACPILSTWRIVYPENEWQARLAAASCEIRHLRVQGARQALLGG